MFMCFCCVNFIHLQLMYLQVQSATLSIEVSYPFHSHRSCLLHRQPDGAPMGFGLLHRQTARGAECIWRLGIPFWRLGVPPLPTLPTISFLLHRQAARGAGLSDGHLFVFLLSNPLDLASDNRIFSCPNERMCPLRANFTICFFLSWISY